MGGARLRLSHPTFLVTTQLVHVLACAGAAQIAAQLNGRAFHAQLGASSCHATDHLPCCRGVCACSGGVLALASCSSHINFPLFHQICDSAVARARRTATVLGVHGQPADHPFPAACPELRYLKLVVHLLD